MLRAACYPARRWLESADILQQLRSFHATGQNLSPAHCLKAILRTVSVLGARGWRRQGVRFGLLIRFGQSPNPLPEFLLTSLLSKSDFGRQGMNCGSAACGAKRLVLGVAEKP